MTLSTTASRVSYAANGTTVAFAFNFKIWAPANLKVYLRNNATLTDTLQTLNSDYTIDIVTYPNTGQVVFASSPPNGTTVVILRDMPLTQDLDLTPSGSFAAETVEQQLDKLVAEIQTLRELIGRSPRLPVGAATNDLTLPEPRAGAGNQLLGITAAGDGYELKSPTALSLQTVSSYMSTLLDDTDAATARTTLGIGTTVDLNLLATDLTGGVFNDLLPFVDASEANATNKVPVDNLFYNYVGSLVNFSPDPAADYIFVRDEGVGTKKALVGTIGVGKQTIWIPAGAMIPRTSNGPATGTVETAANQVMIKTLDFDPNTWEFAQFSVQMPKGWNEGSFTALFVWSHAATAPNYSVVWGIQGRAFSDNDPLDAAFGAAALVTDTGGTANQLYRSAETAAFTVAGPPLEQDLVTFQIMRAGGDPADTLAIDARLHGVALFYTTNANTDT